MAATGELQQRDFARTLARGLGCLEILAERDRPASVSEIAAAMDVHRASARRLLLTLEDLGYVTSENGRYMSAPKLLSLGRGVLNTQSVWTAMGPEVLALADEVNEPSSIAVLVDVETLIMYRDNRRRIYTSRLSIGDRLPAHRSALGRVLLAALSDDMLERRLEEIMLKDPQVAGAALDRFKAELVDVRANGYAVSIDEIEEGLLSLAVPLRERSGRVVASISVASHRSRMKPEAFVDHSLPKLKAAAARAQAILQDFQDRGWAIV